MINVKDYASVDAAILDARAKGEALYFPGGEYLVDGLVVQHGDALIGDGRDKTVIKLNSGVNKTVISGKDAYSLFLSPTYNLNDGANNILIQGMTIDGNRQNNPLDGDGVAIWGYGTKIKDVTIRNCRHDGLRTAWTDGIVSMEGTFENIVIDTVGYHGWRFDGPHDSHVANVMVIDASQEADNGFTGFCVQSGNGRFFNIHSWHRSTTSNRCYAAMQSAGGCEVVASHFEGARTQQVKHNGSGDRFIGCYFYAPFGVNGTSLVVFNGNSNQHIGCSYAAGNGVETTNQVYALKIGDSVAVANNQVEAGFFNGFDKKTPFNFANSSGINRITGRGYANPAGVSAFGGTVNASDEVDFFQSGTLINYRKPQFFGAYASNAAAASAGVPVNGVYVLTGTNALTVRV